MLKGYCTVFPSEGGVEENGAKIRLIIASSFSLYVSITACSNYFITVSLNVYFAL